MDNNTKSQSDNQFTDYLKNKGKKLGYLIANSSLSQEMQFELVELLPKMNIEQIDRLIRIFEAKFINEKTNDIDKSFQTKIEEMIGGFKKVREEKKEEISNTIKNYNKNLNI